jgi:PAS domain S-box-containing protein
MLKRTIEANLESELKNSTNTILNMIRTSVSTSIKNHLRASARQNIDIIRHFYNLYAKGILTEEQAKENAASVLLSQKVGETGYIACTNSKGVLVVHPQKAFVGKDISHRAFVQEMISRKEGYIEYYWQNPGETRPRSKALYMSYFKPWDWIVDISSYRSEFSTLINVDDFRESILSLRFGETGYSFVIDNTGNMIIHPRLEGINILRQNELPRRLIETMLQEKSGKIVYSYRTPSEVEARKKLIIFNYIPEVDWIVASSSYLNEFYSPLENVSNVFMFTISAILILVLPITFIISSSMTNPLKKLINRVKEGASSDFAEKVQLSSNYEIHQLTLYFNSFIYRIEQYNKSLQAEIAERRHMEEALRESEERYRSVMEAAPDPIIVYDMEGKVVYMNPAFSDVFGWDLKECLGKKMDHFVPEENWEETRRGLKIIISGKTLPSVETRRYTKEGKFIDVSIKGSVFRDIKGELSGSVIIHRDVSDVKRLEKEVMDIGDRERQRIGQSLHDDLCPHLIGIEGLGKVLKKKLDKKSFEASGLADKINMLIRDAVTKSRQLARGLCPVYLMDRGLEASLHELAMNIEPMLSVSCVFRCREHVLISDNIVATHMFYIAQEAVHNAVRHGKAKQITIDLSKEGNKIALKITDDGLGIPEVIETDGMGLRIMGFRAKMINASLEIGSGENGGTEVCLHLIV